MSEDKSGISLSDDVKKVIVNKFNKVKIKPCPRCGSPDFTLIDGYSWTVLQSEPIGVTLGGTTIPTVVMICTTCGFLSQHELGVFGLIPDGDTEPKKQEL